jgi:hypothetical protein
MYLDDAKARLLERARKEQEAKKKKENSESETSWKMLNVKKSSPYSYGKPSFGGEYGVSYGGGSSGLGNWALQQLLLQQLSQGTESGGQGKLGGAKRGPTPAASGSGQHDAGYAARMAGGHLQYPCHGCGVHGHWKKDGECNPADVAAFMKKKMAEQAKKDAEEEEAEDAGKDIYWLFYSYIYDGIAHPALFLELV